MRSPAHLALLATDEQRAAALARAAEKRARKNARRLAPRDLARLRSMQDAIARAEALHRYCSERGLALAGGEP